MKSWIVWIIAAIALGGLVFWRIRTKGESGQSQMAAAAGRRGGGPVEVAIAKRKTIRQTLDAVGNIESPSKVLISPKFTGRIEFLEVREGDMVSAGQPLVRLDPSEIQAQVLQQQANVAEARSRYAQAELNQGPTNAGIQGQIEEQQAGLSTAQADLQQVERNYDAVISSADSDVSAAKGRLRSAESQVKVEEAELGRAQANLANAQSRASRLKTLVEKGYVAAQSYDDALTLVDVQKGAVNVANSQLAAARSAVETAQAQLKGVEQQRKIVQRKGQADIISARARVAQSKAGVKVADANRAQTPAYKQNLAALKSSIDAAVAQLQQAQSRLADTVLRSPIAGTVTARNADLGSLASPSQPILEVQALDNVFVTASFPIEQSGVVHVGQTANIVIEALPGREFVGQIANVNFAADPLTRQFSILIKLANPERVIRPGMYASISLTVGQIDGAIVVPREAVKTAKGESTVVVVGKDKKAVIRAVKLGSSDKSDVQIIEGIEPGDQVVTLSYAPIKEGQDIAIADKKEPKGRPKK